MNVIPVCFGLHMFIFLVFVYVCVCVCVRARVYVFVYACVHVYICFIRIIGLRAAGTYMRNGIYVCLCIRVL